MQYHLASLLHAALTLALSGSGKPKQGVRTGPTASTKEGCELQHGFLGQYLRTTDPSAYTNHLTAIQQWAIYDAEIPKRLTFRRSSGNLPPAVHAMVGLQRKRGLHAFHGKLLLCKRLYSICVSLNCIQLEFHARIDWHQCSGDNDRDGGARSTDSTLHHLRSVRRRRIVLRTFHTIR